MEVKNRKGIILAGGLGTRLYPITIAVSKQLLPLYDKPMIYYPLSTLMQAGIKDILIITNPHDIDSFKRLLDNGSQWGINIKYSIQENPEGIAQAFIIGEDFIQDNSVVLALGDNLFHGEGLSESLISASKETNGSDIFVYPVKDPERYGVVEFNKAYEITNIEEKPTSPKSKYAVTGLYFYDNKIVEKARKIKPSKRGELEITDINKKYLLRKELNVEFLGRGMAWLDTGTFDDLQDAGTFIKTLEKRQGLKVGCPEEIAWRNGLINDKEFKKLAENDCTNLYGNYLLNLLNKKESNIYE